MGRFFVESHREIDIIFQKRGRILKQITFKIFENDLNTLEYHLKASGNYNRFKNILKYDFPMICPAAGAAFLPERLPKSARNRVLMLPRERAELTDNFLLSLIHISEPTRPY